MTAVRSAIVLAVLVSAGCSGVPGAGGITEIPPVPAGFNKLDSAQTAFRAAKFESPEGTWTVNYEGEEIVVVNGAGKRFDIPWSWYPVESGADAAWTTGYRRGNETLVRLEGGNDFLLEETRFFFTDGELREAVKYSVPGPGMGPGYPGTPVSPENRVTRQAF